MIIFLIQAAILIAIAYVIGCMFGSLFHKWFAKAPATSAVTASNFIPQQKKPLSGTVAPTAKISKPKNTKVVKPTPVKASTAKPQPSKDTAATDKIVDMPKVVADDNLKKIKGIGAQNEARLKKAGISTFEQISKLSPSAQKELGDRLSFPGRMERENWVDQAKTLAKGGDTAFSKRVKKGEVQSSKPKPKAKK